MGCVESKLTCLQRDSLTDFRKYYKYTCKKMISKDFQSQSSLFTLDFKKKISLCYGITKAQAEDWITMYIDYMLLAAWKFLTANSMNIYPPYAIQQVYKLHIAYIHDYINFNSLITEERGVISLTCCRLEFTQTLDECSNLQFSYSSARNLISSLVENGKGEDLDKKKQIEDLWQDFEVEFLQNNFNFCFFNRDEKIGFDKTLSDHADKITISDLNPLEVFKSMKKLREFLGIDELITDPEYLYQPQINSLRNSQINQKITEKLNKVSFSAELINTLAWEQRITVQEAKKWIEEYKKFLFLMERFALKNVLCPSEAVKQVWLLHLRFIKDYQTEVENLSFLHFYAPKDLGETSKSRNLYTKTLKAYKIYFGIPDEKIWPSSEKRAFESSKWVSYYLPFAEKCLTEKQKLSLSPKSKMSFDKTGADYKVNPFDNEELALKEYGEYDDKEMNNVPKSSKLEVVAEKEKEDSISPVSVYSHLSLRQMEQKIEHDVRYELMLSNIRTDAANPSSPSILM